MSDHDRTSEELLEELAALRARVAELERAEGAHSQRFEAGLTLLGQASARLSASLDYSTVVSAVAQLGVPRLGDGCMIVLLEDGVYRRAAMAHADPVRHATMQVMHGRYPKDVLHAGPLWDTLCTGRTTVNNDLSDEVLRSATYDAVQYQFARDLLGVNASLNVPLICRGRTLGAISFIGGEGRRFDPADVAVAEELGHHVATAIDNARLYKEAQEAVRARDEFLSVASHELRSPLNTLLLQTQLLLRTLHRDQLGAMAPGRLLTMLENTERQAQRLREIVNKLFDVTRISAGRLDLHLEEMDLSAVVREVVSRLEHECAEAGCPVVLHAEDAVVGRWDRLRIEQVVTNLVANAVKYGRGRPIAVTVTADERAARLSVADQGIGIAPADRDRIFERFERAAGRSFGGLGLGLYIARKILMALGGTIRVTSQEGAGSTFTVELPLGSAGPSGPSGMKSDRAP